MTKRDLIVDAALAVVAEDGLSGFTQPRVSQRAGLRQSHLTYYFPTRDDLLLAVAEEAVKRRVSSFREVLDLPGAAAKVNLVVEILTDPAQTRVLLALVQAADTHPQIRSAFDGLSTGLVPAGTDLLQTFDIDAGAVNLALLRALGTGLAVQALAEGTDSTGPAVELLTRFLTAGRDRGAVSGTARTTAASDGSRSASNTRSSTRKAAPRGPRPTRS